MIVEPQKKSNTVKMVAIVVIFFVLGLTAAWLYNRNSDGKTKAGSAQQSGQAGRAAGAGRPALGITVPPMNTMPDVQEYMRTVRATPIPDDYVVPEYISAAANYDEAMLVLNQRFPDFSNKEGTDLIKAVWDQPVRYQSLMLENKAARLQFRPELSADSTFVRQH
jgi:hypothetical protein